MTIQPNEADWLAEQFEANRTHLRVVAYRILGSQSEADDAVQESWLRLSRADTSEVANIGGWLTTVVARVCLDMLRSRNSRREDFLGAPTTAPVLHADDALDPEQDVLLTDTVGLALLVILNTLSPAERLAFVLHDIFAVSFEEIGPIVGRNPTATRQLASRARRRVRGAETVAEADLSRQREIVDAFLAASRAGDFQALLTLLDPAVVYRVDSAAALMGSPGELHGASVVAGFFAERGARVVRPALFNGAMGMAWAQGGKPRVVFNLTIMGGQIVEIELIADSDRLSRLDLTIFRRL